MLPVLARAYRWRSAFWRRAVPGGAGISLAIVFPVLFFLPMELMPFFGARVRGVAILIWLASLSLALALGRGVGPGDEALIWPYQKGVSLGDLVLEDWSLDLGLLGIISAWWAATGVLATGGAGYSSLSLWTAFFALALATAALAHALGLALSCLGVQRASDLTILLALLSLLAPILTFQGPDWLLRLSSWCLPPFRAALDLHGGLRRGDGEGVARSLLHLLAFLALLLWWSRWRMARWKPEV